MTFPSHKTGKETASPDDAVQRHALRRSLARLAAVQALYQVEMTGASARHVVDEFCANCHDGIFDGQSSEADLVKFEAIVLGVEERKSALDEHIAASLSQNWKLERLAAVLRAVLRAASFELVAAPDVPARVVINEYVDLAHAFFEGDEPGFVNGILDRLARVLRAPEMEKAKGE